MSDQQQLLIKIIVDAWNSHQKRTDKMINSLSNEELAQQTAPGRNSGIYLLGHLTAVNDALFPLLGLGEKLYPELEEIFINNPDDPAIGISAIKDLRNYWTAVNNKLLPQIDQLTVDEWFQKHASVNDEDFAKEPHRNKLNVLLSRTNHLAYHLGQLAFLKTIILPGKTD